MALNIKPIKFNGSLTSIRNSRVFRILKYTIILIIFLALIGAGFAVGVYLKLVNVDDLIHKYNLKDVPVIGQYIPTKPAVNFETTDLNTEAKTPSNEPVKPAVQVQPEPQPAPQPSVLPINMETVKPIDLEQQKKEELKRISKLSRIYAAMKPEEAAGIITQLDDDTVVAVLSKMEEEQAAKILALTDSATAARISQRMLKK